MSRLGLTFAALRYPNYRLWFGSQLVSFSGIWMQSTAQGFLVFELTHSPAYLGLVGFAGGVSAWIFTLFGGVVADRVPRRRLLVVTQSAAMLLAVALAALTFLGLVTPWHVIGLAFLSGVVNAFDAPARQSFVLEMVGRPDLTNAIALNSMMWNAATMMGPAVAGVVYAAVGPAWCFAVNALSFVGVIVALLLMRLAPASVERRGQPILADLREGLAFVAHHRVIRVLIAGLAVGGAFGIGMMTLMPAWAVDVLHGDSRTNGALLSARGLGSVVAALTIASLGRFTFKGKLLSWATLALPILMAVFSLTRLLPFSMLVLAALGWTIMATFNMMNSLVQLHTPDALRGRVMGIYTLVFNGFMPIGALLAGATAGLMGAPAAIAANAGVVLIFAAILWLRFPLVRRLE